MLKTNGGNFTETHKKSNSHCCRYDSRRRQEKDGVANQMTEYTWVMKTAEMSSFNAQWEKLFTSLHLTAAGDL